MRTSTAGPTLELDPAGQATERILHNARLRPRRTRPRPPADGAAGLLLDVRLLHVNPPIERRLELPATLDLEDLHNVLLLAFGWCGTHLHRFQHDGRTFAPPDEYGDGEPEDPRSVRIGALLRQPGDRMIWEYDFGDSWTHELRLHATLDETVPRPRLVAGERACPPEDCGGPPGYEGLFRALADPDHPQHAEFSNLVGRGFDPEA
jgi:hypothetical protein